MLRAFRILSLHFQEAIEYRSRSFVWFMLALINPAIYLLFWHGAITSGSIVGKPVELSSIVSYYLVLVVAGALLIAHVEQDVAHEDIKEGGLVSYLLKPYSYLWLKFFEELPYRVVQGAYGVLGMMLMLLFVGQFVKIVQDPVGIIIAFVMTVLALFLSFIFKMIIGILTFWLEDVSGLQQSVFILISLFAGFIGPLEFFPTVLQQIAYVTPFPYMIYFPVMAWTGGLSMSTSLVALAVQVGFLIFFGLLYRFLWRKGVKQFTGVGQ